MPGDGGVVSAPRCACGKGMSPTQVGDVFVCFNCDGLQPCEVGEFSSARVPSPQDHAFNSEMRTRMKKWYPEQFGAKKKGGN